MGAISVVDHLRTRPSKRLRMVDARKRLDHMAMQVVLSLKERDKGGSRDRRDMTMRLGTYVHANEEALKVLVLLGAAGGSVEIY